VIRLIRATRKDIPNIEISRQLTRSAGSVGANYIEANASLGKKDFLMKVRICRKEAKESSYWLRLLEPGAAEPCRMRDGLVRAANELVSIFGAIVTKSERAATGAQN
jgi:four helix bundle protein